jgi:hypothetical protein
MFVMAEDSYVDYMVYCMVGFILGGTVVDFFQ